MMRLLLGTVLAVATWLAGPGALVDGQSYCNEFVSPKMLMTRGSMVDYIYFPLSRGQNYYRNQMCEWSIESDPKETIQLQVVDSNIQAKDIYGECNKDYVNIYDVINGVRTFMTRFCGTENGMVYRTTGSVAVVQFFSDDVYEYKGFTISYQAQKEGENDSGSLDTAVQIAVGTAVGFVLLMLLLTLAIVVYKYRKRHAAQSRRSPPSGASTASDGESSPGQPRGGAVVSSSSASPFVPESGRRVEGRGRPSWGVYSQGLDHHGRGPEPYSRHHSRTERGPGYDGRSSWQAGEHPGHTYATELAVHSVVDPGDYDQGDGGRVSPPPAYESLGYEGPEPISPPSYDSIIKDSEESGEAHC